MNLHDTHKIQARDKVLAEIEYRSSVGRPLTQAGLIEFALDTMQDMLMPEPRGRHRPYWYEEQPRP